jgi:hypothetical protein
MNQLEYLLLKHGGFTRAQLGMPPEDPEPSQKTPGPDPHVEIDAAGRLSMRQSLGHSEPLYCAPPRIGIHFPRATLPRRRPPKPAMLDPHPPVRIDDPAAARSRAEEARLIAAAERECALRRAFSASTITSTTWNGGAS